MPDIFHNGIDAKLTRRGRYFQLTWYEDGNRIRRSTGADNLKQAREIAAKLLDSQTQGNARRSNVMTLSEALERIWQESWNEHSAGPTRRRYVEDAIRILGNPPLDEIGYDHLVQLQTHWSRQGLTGATVNRKVISVRSVLGKAVHPWAVIDSAPPAPRRKERDCRPRVLSEREIERVLTLSSTDHWRWVWKFMLHTGCRKGELLHIGSVQRWDAFDFNADPVKVTLVGKGNARIHKKTRLVPLSPDLADYLRSRRDAGELRPFDVSLMRMRTEWQRIREAMGLTDDPDFVIHALRHTCATRRIKAGMPPPLVQQWLGHSNYATTQRYVNLVGADLDRWAMV